MRLFHRFSLLLLSFLTLVIFGIGLMTVYSEKQLLEKEFDNHFREITSRMAKVCEESLYQNDLVLFNYLNELKTERGFEEAFYIDAENFIRVHSNTEEIGKKNNVQFLPDNHESLVKKSIERSPSNRTRMVFRSKVHYGANAAGWAVCVFNYETIQSFIFASLKTNLKRWLPIGFIAFALALLGSLILARTMTKPIREIVEKVKEVGEGRRTVFPLNNSKDELASIPLELNKTIEKLKELDQMKDEFVSAVTHELRSPLTAIDRFVSLMLKGTYGPINNSQQETLVTIKNNSIRLAQFIDDVLTSSKLDAKKIEPFFENFDLLAVVTEVQKLFSPIALEKGLELTIHPPEFDPFVYADKTMTHHIITNLISNALKFTEKGYARISFEKKGQKIGFHICDSGPGISEKDKHHLFGKFFRSMNTSTKTKGTGLGLFIVKSFIDAQKGEIHLKDNPTGNGTMISVFLPKGKDEIL